MEDSILITVKKLLGIPSEYTELDVDIITNINVAIGMLTQIGNVPFFEVQDSSATWDAYIPDDPVKRSVVKSYITKKTQLMFDSSTMTGAVISALENQVKEAEYRISIM